MRSVCLAQLCCKYDLAAEAVARYRSKGENGIELDRMFGQMPKLMEGEGNWIFVVLQWIPYGLLSVLTFFVCNGTDLP
eukprot:IDg22216t1